MREAPDMRERQGTHGKLGRSHANVMCREVRGARDEKEGRSAGYEGGHVSVRGISCRYHVPWAARVYVKGA